MQPIKTAPIDQEWSHPPFDALSEVEQASARQIGDLFVVRVGDEEKVYTQDGFISNLSVAEAIAIEKMGEGKDGHEFLAQVRYFDEEYRRAQRELDLIPVTPRTLEARASWAWHIKILLGQGDALAGLLRRLAETVSAARSLFGDEQEVEVRTQPTRPTARLGARLIASVMLTPRILSQRPIIGPHARAAGLL